MNPLRALSRDTPAAVTPSRQIRTFPARSLIGFSEEQLRFLAESIPQIAWTAHPDGHIDFMNGRWFEYTGLTEEETYQELKSAVHPEDFQKYKKAWERAVETFESYEVEYRFRRGSDGAYRWHLGRGHPVRNLEGTIVKWFGTCTDIHAQKEMEQEVRHTNERLEFLIQKRTAHLQQEIQQRIATEQKYLEQLNLLERMMNTLPMAAAAVNARGKILHANASFRSLFSSRIPGSALPDMDCKTLLQEAETYLPSPGWLGLFALLETGEAFVHEITIADERTFECECAPTSGGHGGFLLLVRDVSHEKRNDGVKAEFMSLASHQLRTPLTAIRWALGRLQKMLQGRMTPDERRLFLKTRESAATMAQTIQMMLSVSRVESGLHLISPGTLSVKLFLLEVQERFADACRAKHIACIVECPEELLLNTDTHVLGEILENLVSNAVKYTPKGGNITLTASPEEHGVRIEVRDTGLGIPKHQQEKIFTKFFRGENVLRVDTQGTGLGLYLVSKLTALIGGSMSFRSDIGKGTTFTLSLTK